jgi:arginyl-tRNA synthetase
MKDIQETLAGVIKKFSGADIKVELTRPDEQFGDYATNVALQLAGRLGRNPREVAEELATKLREELGDHVSEVTIAGPGFVNIRLSDGALAELAQTALTTKPQTYRDRVVLVEYSDPNPFKPLHAGHLYTTLVGDSIARLVEMAGAKTTRLNYGGDVGLHVAKSMWAMLRNESHAIDIDAQAEDALEGIKTRSREELHTRAMYLGHVYAQGHEAYETDEKAKQQIVAVNKRVYQLHADGDRESAFAQIYWTCRQWSYDYFAIFYTELQVVPFDRFIPESDVTPLGVATVRDQLKKGVYQKSDGAVVFDGEKVGLHTRVFINSEGLPTYEAKDVGLSLTKWNDYHFDESIIITAHEQEQYMKVVVASIHEFAPEPAERTKHLTHGVVKLQGGVKMSSRKGNVVTALQILKAAREAGAATGTNPNEETILAAVKYAFAKNRIGADIIYNPEESIALEGNSGPYLQYAHARARSILGKVFPERRHPREGGDPVKEENSSSDWILGAQVRNNGILLDPAERSLARKIGEYPEILQKAVNELLPHHICTYLYELAQEFNRFYEKSKVIGDPRQSTRLKLVELYADTLKDGLTLLGIAAPDHM